MPRSRVLPNQPHVTFLLSARLPVSEADTAPVNAVAWCVAGCSRDQVHRCRLVSVLSVVVTRSVERE